jgi:hypothetical protein
LGDLIRNGAKTISLQTLFGRLNYHISYNVFSMWRCAEYVFPRTQLLISPPAYRKGTFRRFTRRNIWYLTWNQYRWLYQRIIITGVECHFQSILSYIGRGNQNIEKSTAFYYN